MISHIFSISDDDINMDLKTGRFEFRRQLYAFWDKIEFSYTSSSKQGSKTEKNRKEFEEFRNSISINGVGIYRSRFRSADSRISVVV